MRGRGVAVLAGALALLGVYGAADAADVVPGVLTTEAPPPEARPYPELALPGDGLVPASVPELDPEAPRPTGAGLSALTRALGEDYRMTGTIGMVVADVATGEVLHARDPDTPRTTASSVKLLTAAAALDALGPGHQLTTRVVRPAPDAVTLVGGGDIMLADGQGDQDAVNGRAGLADLAAATAETLAADGTTSVSVALDDSLFTGPVHLPDWGGIDLNYVMPIQPLAVDVGQADQYYLPDPALAAARAFAEALAGHGVDVAGGVTRAAAPADAEVLAEAASAPLNQVVRHMLKTSDNSLAEVLGRLVALDRGVEPSFDGAAASVQAQLTDLGLGVGETHLADTSGLSVQDRVPAGVLVEVLLATLSEEHPALSGVTAALPVAGLDGTLAERLTDTPASGSLRAKTGTLVESVSLSGSVVTADGRHLVFATLLNDLEVGTALQARLAVDDWAAELAACGCR
ncbi:D-alanyl-D-alanine carboxypeptidase/D-alanyl-D-alanine-endopeptidase [Georgenia sp. 10Sc9-8]|uniref:D-alanyl-D-alanine carboxypeptidase/D-alanyl-D-alanine-endopeptidase n=1 Tax=Georgenia halotolerans TaxID=3028317 RepID=A0ABT5TY13_9MICO|nr:D-alanyl-D-alanine carboxypeptidase/D-alanyl-D-alanine-endopeptidase [Georgenia halotolerans]